MKLFVSVGTTQFDQLINTLHQTQTLQLLKKIGIKEIKMQIGNSRRQVFQKIPKQIDIQTFKFTKQIQRFYEWADLIICHGGAGTILQCLSLNKRMIVVINQSLQQNHQWQIGNKILNFPNIKVTRIEQLTNHFQHFQSKQYQTMNECNVSIQSECLLTKVISTLQK